MRLGLRAEGAIHTAIADPKGLDNLGSLSFPRKRESRLDPHSPAFAEDELRGGDGIHAGGGTGCRGGSPARFRHEVRTVGR